MNGQSIAIASMVERRNATRPCRRLFATRPWSIARATATAGCWNRRRHGLDGVLLLDRAGNSDGSGGHNPAMRTSPANSSNILSPLLMHEHAGGQRLWDEADGFLLRPDLDGGKTTPLKVRSLVGLLPLIAVEKHRQKLNRRMPGFKKRTQWFLINRKDLARFIHYMTGCDSDHSHYFWPSPAKTGSFACSATCWMK